VAATGLYQNEAGLSHPMELRPAPGYHLGFTDFKVIEVASIDRCHWRGINPGPLAMLRSKKVVSKKSRRVAADTQVGLVASPLARIDRHIPPKYGAEGSALPNANEQHLRGQEYETKQCPRLGCHKDAEPAIRRDGS
jgi:hypothetical protein